jgi:hypothetical protein
VTVAVNVTEFPWVEGFELEVTEVEEVATFTVCVSVEDVLEVSLLSPP